MLAYSSSARGSDSSGLHEYSYVCMHTCIDIQIDTYVNKIYFQTGEMYVLTRKNVLVFKQ